MPPMPTKSFPTEQVPRSMPLVLQVPGESGPSCLANGEQAAKLPRCRLSLGPRHTRSSGQVQTPGAGLAPVRGMGDTKFTLETQEADVPPRATNRF